MKSLVSITPTSEQLAIIANPRPGVKLIRGAAGSGKTTTALLMLRSLTSFYLRRKERLKIPGNVNVLALTYNRTLKGYIGELASQQVQQSQDMDLTVSTFASWAKSFNPRLKILENWEKESKVAQLASGLPLSGDFILREVDYVLGRFVPDKITDYLTCSRDGRGIAPRMERALRQKLLDTVIDPYIVWKKGRNILDWNDIAINMLSSEAPKLYDIIIADEVQDLSANQVRAIMHCVTESSSVIFVLDAAQRIYPQAFTWLEAGVEINKSYRLKENHRNTKEICQFALPLLVGLEIGDDGTLPDLQSCNKNGPLPLVLVGKYSEQVAFAFKVIKESIDLSVESVAFLHPLGGKWFNYLRSLLRAEGLDWVELTREGEWPTGPENIALSTMHSAKGLEFDHVFILGLNDEVTPHGEEHGDSTFENLQRVLAMAVTRARKSVIIGYKSGEASKLIGLLQPDTYREIIL